MKILGIGYRSWAVSIYKNLLSRKVNIKILKKKTISLKTIQKYNPDFILFYGWSSKVNVAIVKKFKCIMLHPSKLPKFAGGSPIQNQIIRGIKNTKSTAFLMNSKLDAGDILLQKKLSLDGSLDEILSRIEKNNYELITKIIQGKFKKRKQTGKPTSYKRRTPKQSELKNLNSSKLYLHNFIRMLSDPYPNAFIKIGKKKIIFKSSKYDGKTLAIEGVIE